MSKIASRKAAARDLQKLMCKKISELLGIPWGKDCLIASREMGQSGVDVKLIGAAREAFPFSIECKNEKIWNLQNNIKQAKANCLPDTDWILVMKRRSRKYEDRIPPVIIMDVEAFFRLISRLKEK